MKIAEVETLLETTMQQAKQALPEGRASPCTSEDDDRDAHGVASQLA